jgi:hypothetical protein
MGGVKWLRVLRCEAGSGVFVQPKNMRDRQSWMDGERPFGSVLAQVGEANLGPGLRCDP